MISLIVLIGIVLSLWLLTLLVLLKNYKSKINIYFALTTFFLSLWFLVSFFEDTVSIEMARILVDLDFALSGLFPVFFCLLFVNFPYKNNPKIKDWYIGIVAIPLILMSFSGMVVTSIEAKATGGISYITGPLFYPFLAIICGLLAVGTYSMYQKYKKSKGASHQQIQYVLLGFVVTAVIMIVVNAVLPRVINIGPDITRFGIYSSIIFIAAMGYAIINYKLMDIRAVVARSLTYVLLLLFLAGFYAAAIFAAQAFIFPQATYSLGYISLQMALAVIMAFSFQPLRFWITKVTDNIFFRNSYDPEVFLDTMSHTIGSSIVLIELLYKALNLITSQIKITRGLIVVLTDSGKIYTSQAMGFENSPKLLEEDMLKLVKGGVLVYDELPEKSHYKQLLRKYNASLILPLKTDNDTEGLLILGEKLSGDMYSAGDLQVFEIIAPELAVAVNNAKSFEKIEKFNVTLREEVKKATSELEKKNTQLMELDKAKDEFISMASHQLRTPLTAIKGYLSMLLEGDAGEIKVSQYDFVNEAFQGANRMVGLINDLLNVSRMETGRFFLEPVEIDLSKLVQEEVKQLLQHAKEKKLALKFEEKGKTPHVWADETKLLQVVMNFIDNAVYYTTAGTVTVILSHDAKDVIFEVKDTGIGVPKAQQKQLFTKFYRADNARHVRPDGTGLGIYLAKRVLDDHHAQLIFKSEEGKGSIFGFKFPIKSKLSTKRVTAPNPNGAAKPGETCPPAIGELAAGVGVSPQVLEATSLAGIEKPLSDSADTETLTKEAVEMSKVAKAGGSSNSMPADILKSANEAIQTIQESEVKKEEEASKK